MGNICSWCLKNEDVSHTNGHTGDYNGISNSQRSVSLSEDDPRAPLLKKSSSNHNHRPVTANNSNSQLNGESSSYAPFPTPLPSINEPRTDTTAKVSTNETAESKMAFIVEGMLSKLIDVGNARTGIMSTNSNINGFNNQNDHLKQILNKSFSSAKLSLLPDVGLNNLPSLLSGRPISSDICHFVAHTAGELSRLLIEEIKIIHKEELNKNDEDKLTESDIEQDDSFDNDDKNSVTTDDEFFNELMDVPSEFEDHLIPEGCKDEIVAIEHLSLCLNRRYSSCPIFFSGTLQDALKEAFNSNDVKERRPLLIYVNNDKSLYSNVFCKQLLCHDKIVEFFLNNYVVWAWDVTFQSNGEMLNEMYKKAFTEKNIGTYPTEQYPLLIGVQRDRTGDYKFNYFIMGSNNRPVMDEFLGRLIQFKDQFEINEEEFERAKKQKEDLLSIDLSRMQNKNFHPRHNNGNMFGSSTSMFSVMDLDRHSSHYLPLRRNQNDNYFSTNPRILNNMLGQLNLNPNYTDDDEEEEEEKPTPTVEHPPPKFPQ
ncbi:unnamed protein product [Adineta steineri]|uniref:UAS domain-containing protein n=1 Tax=Adineta steineri TaxID=433720 RepID=A0A814IWW5_9BILA|nr:unnamed protein product [Adineta steineri]